MNKQEIITVLCELHKITGFRVSLHGADYAEIAAYPETAHPFCAAVNESAVEHERCIECDRIACRIALEKKQTHIYKCRYGLTEAVSPLYNFGTLTGFLMMGQIAVSDDECQAAAARLAELIGKADEAARLAESIPRAMPDRIKSYVRIMTICAQYLTLSNAIPSARPGVAEQAKRYIKENLSRKFGIGDICDHIKCSKSTLLNAFRSEYGTTVNVYITEERLRRAVHLLSEGEKSISEIASDVGFSDQSYFSKVFSARYGIPPSEYRSNKEHAGV